VLLKREGEHTIEIHLLETHRREPLGSRQTQEALYEVAMQDILRLSAFDQLPRGTAAFLQARPGAPPPLQSEENEPSSNCRLGASRDFFI
jgi:hypothetical protein